MLGESLKLYISTLRNLRSRQVRYQVWYRLRAYIRKYRSFRYVLSLPRVGHPLSFKLFISKYTDLDSVTGHFSFLGKESAFLGWNDESFGKLWSYNLNYMDYLHQETISFEQAVCWIDKFVDEIEMVWTLIRSLYEASIGSSSCRNIILIFRQRISENGTPPCMPNIRFYWIIWNIIF